ncbi:MAG: PHP domain-containing protein [Pseudomonadales bacterium]|nr:PHP domain-containing protein [Pseudomonadales bacterium]NRA16797.1 PHP domain-containing protein [Oceanospirillaceae bacterium]
MIFSQYDLHTHTTASDGVLSPVALYESALQNEIKILAVTDHDTVAGCSQLLSLQRSGEISDQIKLISGAELTCVLDRQVLHIVALGIQIDNPALIEHLSLLESLRLDRAERIAAKLVKKKLPDILSLVYEKAAGGQVGRPHFAKVLCDLKLVSSEAEAFKKYLGAGKVANVSVEWPSLEQVINVIKQSAGVSVLAHPTKYKLTMSKLRRIIAEFKLLGGDGIEISYPGVNIEQQNILKFEIEKHQLLVSAGSDFHTPENKWTTLGRYPKVADDLPHILTKCLADPKALKRI